MRAEAVTAELDILVVGAGMVGATTAALLSRAGFAVGIVEAHEPKPFDPASEYGLRLSAVSPGSRSVLEQAGAWRLIAAQRHCPYSGMSVLQQDSDQAVTFQAQQFGLESLGYIIENQLVQGALWQTLNVSPTNLYCPQKLAALEQHGEQRLVTLAGGEQIRARLVVGADGAASRVRKFTGIEQQQWEYNQRGLVCLVQTERPNPGVAWQRFLPTGPVAFLPLQDGRSSIVWTLPADEAEARAQQDDASFRQELEAASQSPFGAVTAVGERASFPLSMKLSSRYVENGVVLLGDAAHVVHPLAGQGVNLGLLDAAALAEVLIRGRRDERNLDDPLLLRRFERWRVSDNAVMAAGIHGIHQLYSLPRGVAAQIRSWGASLVDRSWLTKSRFLQHAAGQHSDSPALARGVPLQQLLHA